MIERPPVAWLPVGVIAAGTTTVLLATAGGYDYHRDELYFRLLGQHPAWGYVDQPPFTPLLTRLSIAIFGDTVWAIRIPGALMIGVVAILAALVAREVGAGRLGQSLAALGALTGFPLIAGHITLTATPDLIVWLVVILLAMRALLRDRPRLWLGVGLTVGLGLYNKHLVVLLLLMLAAGLLLVGPRKVLLSPWVYAGMGIALVVGLPNLVYQVVNDFPQLDMAAALARDKGEDARITMLPLQLVMLGVPYVPIWIAGLVTLLRDRRLRPIRALAVTYPLMIVLLLVIAGQPYYTLGLLLAIYAIGCAPVERWLTGMSRRVLVGAAVVANIAISAIIALPIVPAADLGDTVIPEINQGTRDQIGWQTYVRQVADVYAALPPEDQARAVIVTGNYGEAGAIERYGRASKLPKVYSGQNELYHYGPPPEDKTVAVLVLQEADPGPRFNSCTREARLDNGLGVDNEEQVADVWVCRGPSPSWSQLWPRFQHFS
jgi:hypothetical protein